MRNHRHLEGGSAKLQVRERLRTNFQHLAPELSRGVVQHDEILAGLDLDHLELSVDEGEAARSVLALRLEGPAGVACVQKREEDKLSDESAV